ncbi:MAG: hypothetical protein [Bacteriophage sp.]|nr:MAG: hypothetical protein [Bacteriophage sp.]
MNALKIVTVALKQLGVLAAGENASGEEVVDALEVLQDLLSQWATSRLFVYKSTELTLPLSKGGGVYRIGRTAGDCCEFELLCQCGCDDNYQEPELKYPIPDLKADISHISETAWLDGREIRLMRDTNSYGYSTEVTYQVDKPSWIFKVHTGAKELKIKAFTLPFDLCEHDELHLPKEYERALKLSLAMDIAPMFGVEPSMSLTTNQRSAIDLLKRANSTPMYIRNDMPRNIGVGGHGFDY